MWCYQLIRQLTEGKQVFQQLCTFAFIWLIRMGLKNQTLWETKYVLREDISRRTALMFGMDRRFGKSWILLAKDLRMMSETVAKFQ